MYSKYGDVERVKQDVITVNEIIDRQGTSLLIDVIAEHVGNVCLKFKLSDTERFHLRVNYTNELHEALLERT